MLQNVAIINGHQQFMFQLTNLYIGNFPKTLVWVCFKHTPYQRVWYCFDSTKSYYNNIAEVSTKLKRSNYPEYQNLHLYIYFLLNINLINEFGVCDILISNNIAYGAMSGNFSYLYSLHNHMQDSTIYRPIGHQLSTCDKHNDVCISNFLIFLKHFCILVYIYLPHNFLEHSFIVMLMIYL